MNVLILTPGRVGSTPLQRVLTIQMLNNNFDKPVINFHDLLHGIEKVISPITGTEILNKIGTLDNRDLTQSLSEINNLLDSTDHYKVARIAYYGVLARKDPIVDQQKFYDYLNKNYHIIRCERDNLLEFALSWIITTHSNTLNVDSTVDKINAFEKVHTNSIVITKERLLTRLGDYKDFINWSETYFNIHSHFNYESSINKLEQFIMNLQFMHNKENTWYDMFGITFEEWNKCHNTTCTNTDAYEKAYDYISDAVTNGYLPTNISVKLQSYEEKKSVIKNFDECVVWYNEWLINSNSEVNM